MVLKNKVSSNLLFFKYCYFKIFVYLIIAIKVWTHLDACSKQNSQLACK